MLLPPTGFDEDELLRLMRKQFAVRGGHFEFFPLGEDSWSYRLGRYWISVRRDLRGHVPIAYRVARLLRNSGLPFVVAPLEGADGSVVYRVDGFPVVVFPYLPVMQVASSTLSDQELYRVIAMISEVHRAKLAADLPEEDYRLSFDDDLVRALACASGRSPNSGPYGARLHRLLRHHRKQISSWRAQLTQLASSCRATAGMPVLTHGEPSAQNILRLGDTFMLADWGGTQWGPPERDWFHVVRTLRDGPPCRPAFLSFYEMRWMLSEIAEYSSHFLAPHVGDAVDHAMWEQLLHYLPES